LKTYTKHNFFKHTYCEFKEVSEDLFKENPAHYKSKSDSLYHYTHEGVYRYADHWGRVANCRWKLSANDNYKSQQYHLGFAKWVDFCPLNNTDKLFFIEVNYESEKVTFQHVKLAKAAPKQLFTALEAQKRVGQIRKLFEDDKWAKYFELAIDELRKKVIEKLSDTTQTLQQIKRNLK